MKTNFDPQHGTEHLEHAQKTPAELELVGQLRSATERSSRARAADPPLN